MAGVFIVLVSISQIFLIEIEIRFYLNINVIYTIQIFPNVKLFKKYIINVFTFFIFLLYIW